MQRADAGEQSVYVARRWAAYLLLAVALIASQYVAEADVLGLTSRQSKVIVKVAAGGAETGEGFGVKNGKPAREARFGRPAAVAVDRRGNLYIADNSEDTKP